MGTHKDLEAWKKALDLVDLIYDMTESFPPDERYDLVKQLRRCAVSVPSNIAEGCGRNNKGELKQFLGIARGSLAELETQCIIAKRRQYLRDDQWRAIDSLRESVSKLLFRLAESL